MPKPKFILVKTKKKRIYHRQATGTTVKSFVDQDYWHKLSKEEKDWLNKFNAEYYYDKAGKNPIHPKELIASLHSTTEGRRTCYNIAHRISLPTQIPYATDSPEDTLIKAHDVLRILNSFKKKYK